MQVEAAGTAQTSADRLGDERVGHDQTPGTVFDEQAGRDRGVRGVEEVVAVEPAGVDEDRQRREVEPIAHAGDPPHDDERQ